MGHQAVEELQPDGDERARIYWMPRDSFAKLTATQSRQADLVHLCAMNGR